MAGKLAQEIHQERPFFSLEQEVYLNLQRTADGLLRGVVEVLKAADLTPTQYNVLRILRGAGGDGLPCQEIGRRMITRDPDLTRLFDRLERRGLVSRHRQQDDRRVVKTRITEAGLALVGTLDAPTRALHPRQLGHLGRERLQMLNELLEAARAPLAGNGGGAGDAPAAGECPGGDGDGGAPGGDGA